jgi:hypothetical protein
VEETAERQNEQQVVEETKPVQEPEPLAGSILGPKPQAPAEVQEKQEEKKEPPVSDYEITIEGEDPNIVKEYTQLVKQLGLSKDQAEKIVSWAKDKGGVNIEKANEIGITTLQKEWGNQWQQNLTKAQRAFTTMPPDVQTFIDSSGLGSNPVMVKAFYHIAQYLTEDKAIDRSNDRSSVVGDAKAEIMRVLNDSKHPYHNKKMPGHQEAVEAMQRWYQQIYGE